MCVATVEVDGEEISIEKEDVYLATGLIPLGDDEALEKHDAITVTSMELDAHRSSVEFVVRGSAGRIDELPMREFAERIDDGDLLLAEPV